MKVNKKLFTVAVIVVVFLCTMFILKDFSLKLVQVTEDRAVATINFLFPMDKDKFESSITLSNNVPQASTFDCMIDWKSDTTVQLTLQEKSEIKGQSVKLKINNAPSLIANQSKNATLSIQFKSPVQLLEPTGAMIIATDDSFIVKFNTPMDKKVLHKYLQSDTQFYIEEMKITLDNGQEIVDPTSFNFTPKEALENGEKYILSFRKGMPSQSGVMLDKNINIVLNTDFKPQIEVTYPENGNNWIGLYPRISLEVDRSITKARLYINNEVIEGKVIKDYKAEFLLKRMLKPSTQYTIALEVETATGEKSIKKDITFTTVPIKENRIWVEIKLGNEQNIIVHKGDQTIKTIICSGGTAKSPTPSGTYYIMDKGERYFDDARNEGANSWITLSEDIKIHGITRDEYWNIKQSVLNKLGEPQTRGDIVVSEEDALWLCNTLPIDTMVIIRE